MQAVPSAERLRAATLEHIRNETELAGIDEFTDYLGDQLAASTRVPTRDLTKLAVVAECIQFLKLSENGHPTLPLAEWILGSGERLHLLIDMLEPQDRGLQYLEIMDRLRSHDPEGCGRSQRCVLCVYSSRLTSRSFAPSGSDA
ncbi:MAG: hypothetical protein ABFS02_09170 [Pseudomonadota bacterium]